jgi:hypothetical protein
MGAAMAYVLILMRHIRLQEFTHVKAQELISDPLFFPFAAIAGMIATIIGGYITGRIAKQFPLTNSFIVAILVAALCLVTWSAETPLWNNILGITIALVCPYMGAVIAARRWA